MRGLIHVAQQGSDDGSAKRRTWMGAILAGGIVLVIVGIVVGAILGFATGAAIGAAVTETGSECQFEECVDPGILPGATIGLVIGALIGGFATGALWFLGIRRRSAEPAEPGASSPSPDAAPDADATLGGGGEPGGTGSGP
jgi:hypothetical protein